MFSLIEALTCIRHANVSALNFEISYCIIFRNIVDVHCEANFELITLLSHVLSL